MSGSNFTEGGTPPVSAARKSPVLLELTNRVGKLRSADVIAEILGKNRLRDLSFDIPKGKLTALKAVMLNRAEEKLPSESDITKADDIELQEIMKNASKSTEDLISQMRHDQ